ncbi:MAG: glycoside hydrolase family 31 protein [Promicromonosporaceae bacterium]|nr:glycoside hydrolase family 31 protein [Promicromonosporaceae bacterium]
MSLRQTYDFSLLSDVGNTLTFRLANSDIRARVFVLEPDIIRVLLTSGDHLALKNTWLVAPGMADIPMSGRSRLDISGFSLPSYQTSVRGSEFVVETDILRAVINLNGFKISWFYRHDDGDFIPLMADRKTQAYNFDGSLGTGIYHYLERHRDESYYGLGEKAGTTDRYGKRYRMVNVDPMGYDAEFTDPLYKHIPFYITRNHKTDGVVGLFYDNMSQAVFDLGREMDNYHGPYRYFHSVAGDLDYYVIGGRSLPDIVKRYSWLTGQTIFPPKWSLGYSGSTMTYTDLPESQKRLNEFLRLCEVNDILCDSFQLSSGYTSIGDKRYVFNWNFEKFPTPKEFTRHFHEKGVRLCANIKPALLIDHPKFSELAERGYLIKSAAGQEPELAQFWDEIGGYIDFTNPEAVAWWKEQVTKQLLEYGIDSTWNDNNEFEIWATDAVCAGFGEAVPFESVRALQPLLMMKSSWEAQREFAPEVRPYLISRSGCPGMQRYAQTWTGDNYTAWKTVKYNIKMAIGLSLSGIYNIGHDVGGFSGPAPDPELFVRWVQNGIFYPRFTIHSWNDDKTVNVPWMYPEVTDKIRDLIKFRNRLIPYLYTLLYQAHEYYEPIIRPTFYDFGADAKTYAENDDFLLGDSLLITSVVEPGVGEREVYLPETPDGWYDYHTGQWYAGGQKVTIPAPLDYAPFLVNGNSIIPVNVAKVHFETKSIDERGFELFPAPGVGNAVFESFEDDGLSANFETDHAKLRVTMESGAHEIAVTITKSGPYQLPYDEIKFILPSGETRTLKVNGIRRDTIPESELKLS